MIDKDAWAAAAKILDNALDWVYDYPLNLDVLLEESFLQAVERDTLNYVGSQLVPFFYALRAIEEVARILPPDSIDSEDPIYWGRHLIDLEKSMSQPNRIRLVEEALNFAKERAQ